MSCLTFLTKEYPRYILYYSYTAKCTIAAAFSSQIVLAATAASLASPLPGLMLAAALTAASPVCEGVDPCASLCGGPVRNHGDVLVAVGRVADAVQQAEDILANFTHGDEGHIDSKVDETKRLISLAVHYQR